MVDFRRSAAADDDGYESAVLRVHGRGDEPVENIVGMLNAINTAYEGIVRYHFLLDRLYAYQRWKGRYVTSFDSNWPPAGYAADALPPGFRMSLKGVRLQSPGFWDFLGKLNPLEVLRNAINDAHERRKDRDYRESAEKERLRLDNAIKENEALAARIAILRDLGMTNEEMAQVRTTLIHRPIEKLIAYQNTRLIDLAELNPTRETDGPPRQFDMS